MGRKSRRNKKLSKRVMATKNSSAVMSEEGAMKEMIKNATPSQLFNGLSDALGLPQEQGAGSQLSQTDTLFKNNRWYLVSNMRQLLSEIYIELGLVETIVDIPVDDGLRGGIEIKTSQLDEEQIQELQSLMEQEGDVNTCGQALKWNRLFGGAAVLVISGQDPRSPMDWDAIDENTPVDLRAIDMWELYYSKQNTDDFSAAMDSQENDTEYYNYYGVEVHKSRVFLLKGKEAPSLVRPKLRGWGVSVVETLVRSINQYLKATDLTFEVLDEFKLDIFKIKGLTSALHTKEGHELVRKRVSLTNAQKNYQNAITMDAEDDYVQKQLSFAGLADVMEGIRLQIASELKMPLTKIFGISSAGFSSGEDDIENYNAMIESGVRAKAKPILLSTVKIRCMQLFGFIPDDLMIEYMALRMLSTEQEENVKNSTFNRVLQARQVGELSRMEFREMINHDDLLPIRLETDGMDEEIPETPLDDGEASTNPISTGSVDDKKGDATDKSSLKAPEAGVAKNSTGTKKKRKFLPNFGLKKKVKS